MAAAFELSRAGKKVLLLEQHNLPGGYASSFVRGRFEFEPSLHEMPDMRSIKEATGVVRYLLDDAKLELTFKSIPDAYRLILTEKNIDVTLPFGKEKFIDTIEKTIPGSRKSVEKYMDLCSEVQDAFGYLNKNAENLNYRDLLKKHGNFIRTGSKTADEVADALDIPINVRDILYPYWCYLGVPTERVSFSIWAALLNSYISSGAVIPAMRSHELASAFVSRIEEFGGEIRYNSLVNKIIVKDGAISGVEILNGEIIQTNRVISNASPTLVFNSLISPVISVPDMALQNVNSRKLGFSLVVVYLGLDADMEELGLTDYSYFIAPHMNTDKLYNAIYNLDTNEIMQATVCLNAANPDCSPPGTTILAITAGYRAEAWADVEEKDYFKTKNIIADKLISQFEGATGVNLRDHIEEIEVATPETFARYTGAHNGIVYGYEPEPWDSIIPRALSVENEDYIKGLTFCGGFSVRCHGYGSSILSGKAAAERMIKQMDGAL